MSSRYKDWPVIKRDYESGTPVELLAKRYDVSVGAIKTRIKREQWEQKSYQVVLNVNAEERAFWQSYVEEIATTEGRYNIQQLSSLIQSEILIDNAEKALIKKMIAFIEAIDENAILAELDRLQVIADLIIKVRNSRMRVKDSAGIAGGEEGEGAISPLQIVYAAAPPNGEEANGYSGDK